MNITKRFATYIFGSRDINGIGMGLIFSITALAFPIIALSNSRAVVPLIAIMALCAVSLILRRGLIKSLLKWDVWLLVGVCGLLISVVHGAFHVADVNESLVSSTKIVANILIAISVFFAATYLTHQEAMAAARCVTIGTFCVTVFLFCDILSNGILSFYFTSMVVKTLYKFFWFKSASSTLAICSLVTGFYLVLNRQYWNAAVLIAASIFIQVEIGNRTAAGGLVVALVCGLGYHLLGQFRQKFLAIIIIFLFLAPTYILSTGVSAEKISQFINVRSSATISLVYRMYAWEFVIHRINEKPVIGWGLDGSKEFGGENAKIISDPVMGSLGEPVPSHPHNGLLEIWLELGLFGVLSVLILVLRGIIIFDRRCLYAKTRIWTFSILTLLTCFFTFSYSAFSSAWIANLIFTIAMTYPLCRFGDKQVEQKTIKNSKNI
jgi:O-antigen ligase